MDIFIDFDGTIASDHSYGPPMKDAVETINSLYDKGYQIVIYSCRSTVVDLTLTCVILKIMKKWLHISDSMV